MSFLLTILTSLNTEEFTENKLQLLLTGEESYVINSQEVAKEFYLGHNITRSSLVEIYTGKRPDNTFIRYHSPWSNYNYHRNLFKEYNWKEVTISVSNKQLKLIKGKVDNELLVEHILENKTDRMQKMTPRFVHTFENVFTTKWTKEQSLAKAINLGITLGIKESNLASEYSFTETFTVGKEESKTNSEKISIESGGMFEVPAKTCTKISMYGKSAKIKAVIEYIVTLSGNIVVTYDKPYFGHYFWAFEVNKFLHYFNIPNKKIITQEIELSYLFNTYNKIEDLPESKCAKLKKIN